MTHHTDTERAEFEAWYIAGARKSVPAFAEWSEIELREGCMRPDSGSYRIDYARIAWDAWQAARRAPVVPQEGLHRIRILLRVAKNQINKATMSHAISVVQDELEKVALSAAPQPPEADHIPDAGKMVAAPVQLPEPVAYLHECGKKPSLRTLEFSKVAIQLSAKGYKSLPLYTEQQVRQLLAAHGIKVAP